MSYQFDQLKVNFLIHSENVKKVERKNKIIDILAFSLFLFWELNLKHPTRLICESTVIRLPFKVKNIIVYRLSYS